MPGAISISELTDGGQTAEFVADRLIEFIDGARRTLDFAMYDVRIAGEVGDRVADAIRGAQRRGVTVRMLYNADGLYDVPVPPPPSTRPDILATLGVSLEAVPGEPDLMHHKYVLRDGTDMRTGSTNWTLDSWTREENVICALESPDVVRQYQLNFEELWRKRIVERSGLFDSHAVQVGDAVVRPWFCPGHGEALALRIAEAIGLAKRRVRIASPVLTSGPILGALAELAGEQNVDVAGVCDWTQLEAVFGQWKMNSASHWKMPLLARVLEICRFNGKRSTPYAPGRTHDYMHAKIVVADDITFVGSFNFSRSGERNAENVLEIRSAAIADQLAAFVNRIRDLYPDVEAPKFAREAREVPPIDPGEPLQ